MRSLFFVKIFAIALFLSLSQSCSNPESQDPGNQDPSGMDPLATPMLNSITPALASTTGGIVVKITGSGFTSTSEVTFNNTLSPSVTFVSNTELQVTVPAMPGVQGTVTVQVTNRKNQQEKSVKNDHLFSYFPAQLAFDTPSSISGISNNASVLLLDPAETGAIVLAVATPNGQTTDLSLSTWDATTQTFQNAMPFSSPMNAITSLLATDINGDQKSDLIFGTSDGNVLVYLNDGSAHFSSSSKFVVKSGTAVTFLIPGDFNNDQKPDIGVGAGNYVGALLNSSNAMLNFQVSNLLSVGSAPVAVTALLLDQDNYLDFLVATATQVKYVLSNSGSGFQIALQFTTIPTATGFLISDMNDDQKSDIATFSGSAQSQLTFYLKQDTSWQAQTPIALQTSANALLKYDINGDGLTDLVATGDTGVVTLIQKQADGSLGSPQAFTGLSSSRVIGIADLNNDKKPDLLMFSHTPASGGVSILFNTAQ